MPKHAILTERKLPHSSSSPKSPDGYRSAILPLRSNFGLLSSAHAEKMQALFRLCLLSRRFPYRRSPASGPHGASYEGAPRRDLRNPYSATMWLTVSQSGAFPNCVTRFRGGALRHAKYPKTSYKVQLLDTLKHGRCVFREPAKGKPFVGRGATEHILPDAQNFVRLKYVRVGTSGRGRGLTSRSRKVLAQCCKT